MTCPICRQHVLREDAVPYGDKQAHQRCVADEAQRQSRPFRERVSLDDRGPEAGTPVKESVDRELRD
jgi:hypothetical protein